MKPAVIGRCPTTIDGSAICAALSLKLYFKCLLALEDNDSDDPVVIAVDDI